MTDSPEYPFPATIALLEQAVRDHVFPGCAFGVLDNGEIRAQGVGHFTYEASSPRVAADTVYDLASLTKVLATTSAAMLLYDRGQLPLDTTVADFLPEFAEADCKDGRRREITLGMLLDHSSGLPGYGRLFESARNRAQVIAACVEQPLTATPGTRAEYSDIGFILLGHVLERIAGEPLDRFCRRAIFAPLDMSSTCFCPPDTARTAIPPTENDLSFRHQVIQGEVHDENAWVMGGVSGHAGLFSNATDPLQLAACLLSGGITATGKRLFAPETIRLFATRTLRPADGTRALGWDTPSTPSSAGSLFSSHSIGHLGFTGTSLWVDLDAGLAVSLLTNRTWPDRASQAIRELRPRFHDAVRKELAGEG